MRDNTNSTKNEGLGSIALITMLDKTNYQDWREDIEIELKLRKLHVAIMTEVVDEEIELKARRIILETMDKEHRGKVRDYKISFAIMQRLALSYAEATAAKKYRLLVKFYRFNKMPEDSIDAHLGKMDKMRVDLESLGFKMMSICRLS